MRLISAALTLLLLAPLTGPVWAQAKPAPHVEFLRDIAPILDRSGCSSAACHGKFGGRGGFQLSLLTLSPEDDYEPIIYGGRGRRVNFARPEKSLLLLKATGSIAHMGGQRFAIGSPEYNRILKWLKEGAPFEPTDPRLVSLSIEPKKIAFQKVGQKQKLRVVARYTDGSARDVTGQTVFQSTNDAVLHVTENGVVTGGRWGGGAILGRYLGTIAASFVTLPQARRGPYPNLPVNNVIDRYVFDNLRKLNVVPSGLSGDYEFLRRVTLDTLGRLPTPDEINAFVADKALDKRAKLIDALLDKPEFADFRTLRLADLLRVNPRKLSNAGTLGDRAAALFYEWIWDGVKENKPWDQFVKEILTAKGSTYQNGPACFYRIERQPNDRMENIGQAFLGVRMSCARCHKHPFDRWTTDDYWNFAAFCGKVGLRGGHLYDESIIYLADDAKIRNQSVTGKNRGKIAPPTFLGDKEPAPQSPDMVEELADWVVSPKNPFFARATINRLWSYYFSRGIVNPVDDMRSTTPESVPGLLDVLADELVRSHYDVKHIIRLILNSRTYQLTSVPNNSNRLDDQFFSRYQAKPMPAEALLDMVDQATGAKEQFGTLPDRSNAVQAVLPTYNYFLNAFGESHREYLADIDPKLEPTLVQTLIMINSPYIENKIRGGSAVAEVVKEAANDDDVIRTLYLRTFCRPPTPVELTRAKTVLNRPETAPPAPGKPAPKAGVKTAAFTPDDKPKSAREQARQEEKELRDHAQDLLWALLTSREFYFNH